MKKTFGIIISVLGILRVSYYPFTDIWILIFGVDKKIKDFGESKQRRINEQSICHN
jgi:hypothetical protein